VSDKMNILSHRSYRCLKMIWTSCRPHSLW